MIDFIIKKLTYDLSSHAGLALIGQYLKSNCLPRINQPWCTDRKSTRLNSSHT